jgi:hypothetical protein
VADAVFYLLAALAGAAAGWWARGYRRRLRLQSSIADVDQLSQDDSGELATVMHLCQRLLTGQQDLTDRFNHLAARIELSVRMREHQQKDSVASTSLGAIASIQESSARFVETGRSPGGDFRVGQGTAGRRSTAEHWVAVVESAARDFLLLADSREFDDAAIKAFFAEHDALVDLMCESGGHWGMLAVYSSQSKSNAIGVPAIRVAMRRIDLRPYFDFKNYNGFDPIRGTQVVDCATLVNVSGTWTATKRGLIDGAR